MIKDIFKKIHQKFFPGLPFYLKKELADCDSILDLGCGPHSPIKDCKASLKVGVDMFDPYLKESKKLGIHNQYIKEDLKKVNFPPKSFDAVILIDVLEHLTSEDGIKLLKKIERWAKKKIIIFTPNGFECQDVYDKNPFQVHKSGWFVNDFQKCGFKVVGMNGWKKLRGNMAGIKYKPLMFWWIISDLSQIITYYFPRLSFQLFAVKNINENEYSK